MQFGNKINLIKWFIINLLILVGLYSLCTSHEYIERRSKWNMTPSERFKYRNKRFCSVSLWFLVLFALAITFAFHENNVYALFLALGLYAIFILF